MAYLTAAEVQALVPALVDTPDATLDRHIAKFEEVAERYLGVAYQARSGVTYTDTPRGLWLELPHEQVTAVASIVDADGNAYTHTQLDTARGRVKVSAGVPLTVTYTHGFTAPTTLLEDACAQYVHRKVAVAASGTSRDVLSQQFDGGTTRYATPDWNAGRPTGFLDVDADLNSMKHNRVMVY